MVRRIFGREQLELFDQRFNSYDEAARANPFGTNRDTLLWRVFDENRINFTLYSAEIRESRKSVGSRTGGDGQRWTVSEVFYFWCPKDPDVLDSLLHLLVGRERWAAQKGYSRENFDPIEFYEGCWRFPESGWSEYSIQASMKTRYAHLIEAQGNQLTREDLRQAIEVSRSLMQQ